MSSKLVEMLCCSMLLVVMVTVSESRPSQGFSDSSSQGGTEVESPGERNLIDHPDALANLQMQLLAQQLSEFGGNGLQPLYPAMPGDSARILLAKRQQRYRQCYFNPISCFRK